ncbi:MAG: replication initiator protein [Arizlama microvirus]|nr:MAG: replication initiator protein [Arizlama microvirus]
MPCYNPLQALSRQLRSDGKKELKIVGSYLGPEIDPFSFNHTSGWDQSLLLPCGQCLGCRLERSRQWAVRCLHEASQHENNCYITLTYDPSHLPEDNGLHKDHFQHFMMRLRKEYGPGIRYFHCGEYGDLKLRPHYHSCLFNFDFPDKILHSNRGSYNMYTSESLNSIWGKGFCTLSDMCFNSAAYVARYCVKKLNGPHSKQHYLYYNPSTKKYYNRQPEYATMSRRPGLGQKWFDKFHSDVYPSDFIIINGHKGKPPRYYDKLYQSFDGPLWDEIIEDRRSLMKPQDSLEKLAVKEKCKQAQLNLKKRTL